MREFLSLYYRRLLLNFSGESLSHNPILYLRSVDRYADKEERKVFMSENSLSNVVERDRFAKFIGINLVKVEPGYALASMAITENHLNGVDMVQGGVLFTLADYAFAAASNSAGRVTVSINSNISYYKSPKGKIITAEAKEISSYKKICGYNVDIYDEDNELIARLTATGYIKSHA